MYFKTNSPLTESFSFTIKNLNDIFTIPNDNMVKHTEEKLKRVEKEFNAYYKYDEESEDAILEAIGKIIKEGKYDPLDLPKLDRIHHLKRYMQLSATDDPLSKADFVKFYTVLYRELYGPALPSYMTKYMLLKFIRNRYIVFITFDEDKIEAVHTPISENQYDIMSEIYLVPLKVNCKIFKK